MDSNDITQVVASLPSPAEASSSPQRKIAQHRDTGELLVKLEAPWGSLLPSVWLTPVRLSLIHFVLHLILLGYLYSRRRYKGGYIPLPAVKAREVTGSSLGSEALLVLVKAGLLVTDGQYIVGKKARGYRLSRKALRHGFEIAEAPPRVAKKLKKYRQGKFQLNLGPLPVYNDLWTTLQNVGLDERVWSLLREPKTARELGKRVWRIFATESIRRGHFFFSHDPKTGRCFNNIANYPKELRPYLLLEDHPTAECDIANSQPLFLASIAYGSTKSEERARYITLVQSGRFYEQLGAWAGLEHLDREKLKKRIYTGILFGRDHHRSDLWKVLVQHFPLLGAYIDGSKATAHNDLALRLQKKEADVMMGQIVPRLQREGIRVLTIHDGCLCRASSAAHVQLVMEQEIEAMLGFKPTVKVKIPAHVLPLIPVPPAGQLNLPPTMKGAVAQWQ